MSQVNLLAELDVLAWQLRLRDGAEAAMPRSLRRQLMKSSRKAVLKAQVQSSYDDCPIVLCAKHILFLESQLLP